MPKLIRLYITNVAIGFCIAALFVALLLWFDIAHLRHLIATSDKGGLALAVLWFCNGIVFAGAQFAIAVMRLKDDDDDPHGGPRQHAMARAPASIAARADAGSRRRF